MKKIILTCLICLSSLAYSQENNCETKINEIGKLVYQLEETRNEIEQQNKYLSLYYSELDETSQFKVGRSSSSKQREILAIQEKILNQKSEIKDLIYKLENIKDQLYKDFKIKTP